MNIQENKQRILDRNSFSISENGREVHLSEDLNIKYSKTKIFRPSAEILEANRVITDYSDEDVTTAYKLLRTQVLHKAKLNNWNTIALTSPKNNEGKTLTAVNLSIALAKEVNHTVLLVDLDLRQPGVAACFGYQPQYGLADYLINGRGLGEILFNPGVDRLVVLPGSGLCADSSEMLSSPRMVKLVHELKDRYPERLIIFDLPALLERDDALAFSPYIDSVLVVIEDGKTGKRELTRTVEMLQDVNILGTVINKVG